MGKPLVSICIPTYNRVDALKRCVDSIVRNKYHNPESIEIVISDNCSTDGTQAYVQSIATNKDYNIVYNRNANNIGGDLNFIKVLTIANGVFKKLLNDYSMFTEQGLSVLLDLVKLYEPSRTLLFFSIREKEPFSYMKCDDMDSFVDVVATDTCWIGSYGFWDEDFDGLENKEIMVESKFMQIDWILRLIKKKRRTIVCCGGLTSRGQLTTNYGDYNFVRLYTQSYPKLFLPYFDSGDITKATYERLMKRLLMMLVRWTFKLKYDNTNLTFESSDTLSLLNNCFKSYNWYYPYLIVYSARFSIKHILKRLDLYKVFARFVKKRKF